MPKTCPGKLREFCRAHESSLSLGQEAAFPLKVGFAWLHYKAKSPREVRGLSQLEEAAAIYAVVVLHVVHLQSTATTVGLRRTRNSPT